MITSACPKCGRMRDDHGKCSLCKPFIECIPCIDDASKELHTCGKATAFPAEADTVAGTPGALKKLPHAA